MLANLGDSVPADIILTERTNGLAAKDRFRIQYIDVFVRYLRIELVVSVAVH